MAENQKTKTCLIVHGGAMKSALAAGFVYGLSKEGIAHVDAVIGVSSSVGTAVAVTQGLMEELRSAWRNDLTRNGFVSFKQLFLGKPIFDVDWLLNEIYRKRYHVEIERLINSPVTFITCGYNFLTDQIDFWTNRDLDFKEIAWDAMKSAMTIHPEHGVWIHGYRHTDADLVLYKLYENIPITNEYQTLIISNHHNQTYTICKRIGNWVFRLFQSKTFPEQVKEALRERANIQKRGLKLLHDYIANNNAMMYRPPKNLHLPFWAVLTEQKWLMRYYFDHGQKQAILFVNDPANREIVNTLKNRSDQLGVRGEGRSSLFSDSPQTISA